MAYAPRRTRDDLSPTSVARQAARFRKARYGVVVPRWLGLLAAVACLAGCGLEVQQPDLFLLKRTGNGAPLTELVNTGGTVRCDGSKAKPLPDKLLLKARNVSSRLNRDARHHLNIASQPDSVYRYRVRLQDGTIYFPDTAARTHSELAQLELLAVSIAQGPCKGAAPSR
jgi:hypothetical protein